MKRHGLIVITILIAAFSVIAQAQPLRPFVAGSYAQIQREHAGQPFLVALWSLDCAPCHDELALLGRVLKKHTDLRLVLISTDTPASTITLQQTVRRHGLERAQTWVFADNYTEKLRFEIDRQWRGELPRTYLIHADGRVTAHSGALNSSTIDTWLSATKMQH